MSRVTIYTTMLCPYCHRAKALLKSKGVSFTEVDVAMDADRRREMEDRSGGRRTVPQIFVGEHHIGGSDELVALERAGELDQILAP